MSLSVADVLALPSLESLTIRAGSAWLHNQISWSYVAENESITEWVLGGELVFVTGINHPRDEANLLQLVQEAHERLCAGLVILTGGNYIHVIPDSVIAAANRLGLPLLEQPYTLKIVMVTHAIGTALVQAKILGRSRQHVLEQLLEGDYHSLDLLHQRADAVQLSLAKAQQIMLFKLEGSEALFAGQSAADAEQQLQAHRQRLQISLQQALSELGAELPLVPQGECWIALVPCADSKAAARNRQWLVRFLDATNKDLAPLRLFLGLSTGEHRPERFATGLSEAREALLAAQTIPERLGLCCFTELGVLRLLGAIRDRHLLDQFVADVLGAAIRDDMRHEPVLVPTLEAWTHENGNLALAAQRLGVHRNTLSYRLQRFEALTTRSLNDPNVRLDIAVALMIRRLFSC
ncbi:PucR family transcriptional regulator ligand-binding domain-containing protein [Pseudomonas sp. MMS21-TM103]|uniref:PucR family transcriptional regulator n=1 Tax=Pseudomonas sp. MMS21 TM103 TaxID=2886506 RepID=UPI001EDE1CEF|nr:PucR family transcriptional regulator [Pseudomonas sp. MMS21 TM103]MCG4455272.1 PucR family transcriptional regulator ligand-binding domain-containing protein [Pseudomonas sp. MMS21 TM103]